MTDRKTEKKVQRKGTIKTKLQNMTRMTIIIMGIVVSICGFFIMSTVVQEEVKENLGNVLDTTMVALDEMYPGDYNIVSMADGTSRLYKGESDITSNYEYIDLIKEKTGIEITLFYKDLRVLTTLRTNTGDRIVGTYANGDISSEVIRNGNSSFYSNIDIYGQNFYSLYKPIKNVDGSIVGMMFAGKPSAVVKNSIMKGSLMIFAVSLIMVMFAGIISKELSEDIIKSVTTVKNYLDAIAKGNLWVNLDTKILKRDDELGDMGRFTVHVQKYIKDMTERDTLTRLYTRRVGETKINHVQYQLAEQGVKYCVCIGDIDFFKKFNDNYGHDCGDLVLRSTASIFNECMVGRGFTIRWGGEEFLIIFEDSDMEKALKHLKMMRQKVLDNVLEYDGQALHITMTFGLVPGDQVNIDEIVKKADELLYYGKQHGRNQIVTMEMVTESEIEEAKEEIEEKAKNNASSNEYTNMESDGAIIADPEVIESLLGERPIMIKKEDL